MKRTGDVIQEEEREEEQEQKPPSSKNPLPDWVERAAVRELDKIRIEKERREEEERNRAEDEFGTGAERRVPRPKGGKFSLHSPSVAEADPLSFNPRTKVLYAFLLRTSDVKDHDCVARTIRAAVMIAVSQFRCYKWILYGPLETNDLHPTIKSRGDSLMMRDQMNRIVAPIISEYHKTHGDGDGDGNGDEEKKVAYGDVAFQVAEKFIEFFDIRGHTYDPNGDQMDEDVAISSAQVLSIYTQNLMETMFFWRTLSKDPSSLALNRDAMGILSIVSKTASTPAEKHPQNRIADAMVSPEDARNVSEYEMFKDVYESVEEMTIT